MNFCEECNKIVPDEEIVYYEPNQFHNGYSLHQYSKYVNIAEPSDAMNCCMSNRIILCGKVREPTDFEYFFYETCK